MPASVLKPASTLPTALLLVDIQSGLSPSTGFFGSTRSTPSLESNIAALLASTRSYNASLQAPNNSNPSQKVLIVHVHHNSTNPTSPLYPGKDTNAAFSWSAPIDGEVIFRKSVHSAFGGTELEKLLREKAIKQLLICGITTAHCVSTTTRMASDLNVVGDDGILALVEDGSAAFNTKQFDAETVHKVNVASLEGEFAAVVGTKEILEVVLGEK